MSARDFLARIPHLAVGEVLRVAVPASGGVGPHLNFLVPTACGESRSSTLVTRSRDRVRCPACLAAPTITEKNGG